MGGEILDSDADVAGAETSVERYPGCDPSGSAELWTVQDGVHVPTLGAEFIPRVLDFLMARPKQ